MRRKLHERTKCERLLGRIGREIDDLRLDLRFMRKAAPAALEDAAALGVVAAAVVVDVYGWPIGVTSKFVGRAGLRLFRPGGLGRRVLLREEWKP